MATHSSILTWRILVTEELGGLLSVGSHRIEHDWSDLAAAAAGMSMKHIEMRLLFRNSSFSFLITTYIYIYIYFCPLLNHSGKASYIDIFLGCESQFFFFFTLQYCIRFAISTWICHVCTCVPHPEPSTCLPPHTIPLGFSCTVFYVFFFYLSWG